MRYAPLVLLLLATPAEAQSFKAWLDGVRTSAPARVIAADEAAELAGLGRTVLDWRPTIVMSLEPKTKQDSTLPVVKPNDRSSATMQVQQLVTDWGASSKRMDADAAKAEAIRIKSKRKVQALIDEAARTYVGAYKATTATTAINTAIASMQELVTRAKARNAAEAEVRALTGDIAELTLQLALVDRERRLAMAALEKFGAPKRIDRPTLPRPDAGSSLEADEALALAIAAERELIAARLARLPKLNAFATAEYAKDDTYPDFTVGLRVSFDLFDKAGTDLDRIRAMAEHAAAKARIFAGTTSHQVKLSMLAAHERSAEHLIKQVDDLSKIEATRLNDAMARHKDGKATAAEVTQAIKRVVTTRRQISDIIGELAIARASVQITRTN
jgi:outer membrane protein TolC